MKLILQMQMIQQLVMKLTKWVAGDSPQFEREALIFAENAEIFLEKNMLQIAFTILPLLLCVAYLTLAERKIIGRMQLRAGPSTTGYNGSLQPIADAIKLLCKEIIVPHEADKFLFFLAPFITMVTALIGWAVLPVSSKGAIAEIDISTLYLVAISSLGIYGVMIAGWASNSQYAFLGSIRSAAQMISYEIVLGLCVVCVIMITGTLNLSDIATFKTSLCQKILLLPVFIVFVIAILAETNRHPFDIPEAESELVAGYHVEYSSSLFAMFFLGEYANMIIMSSFGVILFLGGWQAPFDVSLFNYLPGSIWFASKVCTILFIFIWVRASIPRYRYDQLMALGWKVLLPGMMAWSLLIATYVFFSCNI